MIRGTTPTHVFNLSIDTADLKRIRIIYAQNDDVVLVKEAEACSMDGATVTVKLSQKETFRFNCKKDVKIQIRALTLADEVLASPVMKVEVEECLDGEVIL